MEKDTREELKRFEMELLSMEKDDSEDLLDDELLGSVFESDGEREEYEDYDEEDFEEDYEEDPLPDEQDAMLTKKKKIRDRVSMGLMIAICFLSLGIIAVLIYWLENYL